jgi:hypothetical protein
MQSFWEDTNHKYFGSEVLTAVAMKSYIFWDITPSSPLKVNRRLGGKSGLHLQGRRVGQARNQHKAGSKQSSSGLRFTFTGLQNIDVLTIIFFVKRLLEIHFMYFKI